MKLHIYEGFSEVQLSKTYALVEIPINSISPNETAIIKAAN